ADGGQRVNTFVYQSEGGNSPLPFRGGSPCRILMGQYDGSAGFNLNSDPKRQGLIAVVKALDEERLGDTHRIVEVDLILADGAVSRPSKGVSPPFACARGRSGGADLTPVLGA